MFVHVPEHAELALALSKHERGQSICQAAFSLFLLGCALLQLLNETYEQHCSD